MKVLMTGATGFLGRAVLPLLLSAGHEVTSIQRRSERSTPGVTQVQMDLATGVDAGALSPVDAVLHLAQSPRYRDFPAGARDMFAVNVAATAGLLDAALELGAKRFVLASSGGVYAPSSRPLVETAPTAPPTYYLRTKLAAEVLLEGYTGLLSTLALRPFFIYGATQRGMLVPTLASRVLTRQEVVITGDPGLRTNPIHVGDAARAFVAAVEGDAAGAVNVGGTEAVSITDLVLLIGDCASCEPQIRRDHPDAGAGDLVGDIRRMQADLGVVPETSLRTGIQGVVNDLLTR